MFYNQGANLVLMYTFDQEALLAVPVWLVLHHCRNIFLLRQRSQQMKERILLGLLILTLLAAFFALFWEQVRASLDLCDRVLVS